MALRSTPLLATALLAFASLSHGQNATASFRNGSGVNPPCYVSDAPVLGQLWTAEVDKTGHEGAFASVISIHPAPNVGLSTMFGEVLYDITTSPLISLSEADPGDVDIYQLPFPNDMALVGVTGYSQALLVAGASDVRLCNAVDLTPGTSTPGPRPSAAFVNSPPTGLAPHAVTFTDQSSGTISSWSWDFGDGTTSNAQHPSHTYLTPGIYDVSLRVLGPGGFDIQFEKARIISGVTSAASYRNGNHINPPVYFATPPVIAGTWDAVIDTRDRPGASLALIFVRSEAVTIDAGFLGELLSEGTLRITFGGPIDPSGFTAFGLNVPFMPELQGPGTSQAIVFDPLEGNFLTNAVDFDLGFSSGQPGLIANFTGGPGIGSAPHTVSFSDATLGTATSWLWDFGDGNTSPDQNPVYTYTTPGTYSVALIATGPGGFDIERKIDIIQVQ